MTTLQKIKREIIHLLGGVTADELFIIGNGIIDEMNMIYKNSPNMLEFLINNRNRLNRRIHKKSNNNMTTTGIIFLLLGFFGKELARIGSAVATWAENKLTK